MGTWSGYSERGTGSQERGPATFALAQPGVNPAEQAGTNAVAVNGGVRGQNPGNTASTIAIDPNSDRTIQTLVRMGESIMAPKLQELKQRKFMEGMVAAAGGQALAEVVNEQPWYSKIFGDGPVVEGAKAWTVQSKVDAWATKQELSMPELAQMPASEIPAYLTEQSKQFLTGDPELDVQVQANMLRVAPQLIKAHARANLEHNQRAADVAWNNSLTAKADRFEAAARNLNTPDAELDGMRTELLANISPVTGQNLVRWEKNVKAHIQGQIQAGNFKTANLYSEAIVPQMQPAEQLAFAQQLKSWGNYHKATTGGEYLMQAESWEAQLHAGKLSVDDYVSRIGFLNDSFSKATGNPAPIRTGAEVAAIAGRGEQRAYNVHAARMAEDERVLAKARTAQEVEAAKLNVVSAASEALVAGNVMFTAYKQADKEAAFAQLLNTAKPEDKPGLIIKATALGYVDSNMKDSLQQPLRMSGRETPDDSFMGAYAQWQQLNYMTGPNGQPVARPGAAEASDKMYGEYNQRLAVFHSWMDNGKATGRAAEIAYKTAFVQPVMPVRLGHEQQKQAAKSIVTLIQDRDSFFTSMNPFKAKVDEHAERTIANAVLPFYSTLHSMLPEAEQPKHALAQARNTNLELGYGDDSILAWTKPNSAEPINVILGRRLGIPESQHGPSIERAFRAKLDALEDKPGGATWFRNADENGQASFTGFWVKSDGSRGTVQVTGDEIAAQYKAKVAKPKAKPNAPVDDWALRNGTNY
jgi:hypothetical protein